MRTFSNKFPFHRTNLHSALLLSCALMLLADGVYAGTQNFASETYSSAIFGDDDIEIDGGTVTLNPSSGAPNTYTGETRIDVGTLVINQYAIPEDSPIIFDDDTTLRADENIALGGVVTFNGPATLDPQTHSLTFDGAIDDNGNSITVKGGGGTLILKGANDLTGEIYVGDGAGSATLDLEAPDAIDDSNLIHMKDGSTLRLGAGTYSTPITSY